jgi:hypothetical protein
VVGEPLSLEMKVTIDRPQDDDAEKLIDFTRDRFELMRQDAASGGEWTEVEALPLLLVSVGKRVGQYLPGVMIPGGDTTAVQRVMLLAYPLKGESDGFRVKKQLVPYTGKSGSFRIAVVHEATKTSSNFLELTVTQPAPSESGVVELFYDPEHIRFMLAPGERQLSTRGIDLAQKLASEYVQSPLVAYSNVGLGLAALLRRKEPVVPTEDLDKQTAIRESLSVLGKALAKLPADCPLVEVCIVGLAEGYAALGQLRDAKEQWTQFLKDYPSSMLAPHAKTMLSKLEQQ